MVATAEWASKAVLSAILRARKSSQARDPTRRPPFIALACVLCCQLPASVGPCVLPAFGCVIPPEPFMLKTKGCMEVVQATKLRAIGASDQEQAGKFVNGQRVSLSTASFFCHRRRRRALGGGARNSWTASRIGRRHDGSSGSASQLHWIRKRHPGGRHGAGSAIPKVADNRSTAQVPVQIVRRVPQRSSQEPALTLRKADAARMVKRLQRMLDKEDKQEPVQAAPVVPCTKVDIGGGVLVKESVLQQLNMCQGVPGKLARALLRHVFPPEELQGRSLFGGKTSKGQKDGLYPVRLSAVISYVCAKHPTTNVAYIKNSLSSLLARDLRPV
ncbi:uncharacterized protein LOC144093677 isoform X1 [Amblyomma americanum]